MPVDVRLGSKAEVGDGVSDVRYAPDCVAKLGAPVRWGKFVESDSDQDSLVKCIFVFVGRWESGSPMVSIPEPENSFATQSPPKPEVARRQWHFRYVPQSDIRIQANGYQMPKIRCTCAAPLLFVYLVRH